MSPPLFDLPRRSFIRFDDLQQLAKPSMAHVVIASQRDDGSVVLTNRSLLGRAVLWMREMTGYRDPASIAVNQLLTRQLQATRCGPHALSVSSALGRAYEPLRNRDIRAVCRALQQYGRKHHMDPAKVFELDDGMESSTHWPRLPMPEQEGPDPVFALLERNKRSQPK